MFKHSELKLDTIYFDNVYILFLDGDTKFKPKSIALLYNSLISDPHIGGVCGRFGTFVLSNNVEYNQLVLQIRLCGFKNLNMRTPTGW